MKRFLGFIFLAALLVSCSPQRRLAYILEHHPELRTGDSVRTVEVAVPVEAVKHDTTYLPDLRTDTVTVHDTAIVYIDREAYRQLRNGMSVQEGRIKATVRLTDKGLQLSVEQEADTLKHNVDVNVPQYEIEVKEEAELTKAQAFFYTLGIITTVIVGVIIVLFLLFIILKLVRR